MHTCCLLSVCGGIICLSCYAATWLASVALFESGNALGSETTLPQALLFLCRLLAQAYLDALAQRHGFCGIQTHQTHRPQTCGRPRACVLCACGDDSKRLCFAGVHYSPSSHPRVSGVVDIGITTIQSPALDIAALCLDSWPAAIFAQVLTSDSCQRLHVSL